MSTDDDDDDLFASLGGSLMKDLLADLQVDESEDAGWLSLEQLERELAHLDYSKGGMGLGGLGISSSTTTTTTTPALPTVPESYSTTSTGTSSTTLVQQQQPQQLSAASMVVSSQVRQQLHQPPPPGLAVAASAASSVPPPPGIGMEAWDLLGQDFLVADSVRKQQQQTTQQQFWTGGLFSPAGLLATSTSAAAAAAATPPPPPPGLATTATTTTTTTTKSKNAAKPPPGLMDFSNAVEYDITETVQVPPPPGLVPTKDAVKITSATTTTLPPRPPTSSQSQSSSPPSETSLLNEAAAKLMLSMQGRGNHSGRIDEEQFEDGDDIDDAGAGEKMPRKLRYARTPQNSTLDVLADMTTTTSTTDVSTSTTSRIAKPTWPKTPANSIGIVGLSAGELDLAMEGSSSMHGASKSSSSSRHMTAPTPPPSVISSQRVIITAPEGVTMPGAEHKDHEEQRMRPKQDQGEATVVAAAAKIAAQQEQDHQQQQQQQQGDNIIPNLSGGPHGGGPPMLPPQYWMDPQQMPPQQHHPFLPPMMMMQQHQQGPYPPGPPPPHFMMQPPPPHMQPPPPHMHPGMMPMHPMMSRVPVAVPVPGRAGGPAWQTAPPPPHMGPPQPPMPMVMMMPQRAFYCNPHPRAPPIPANQLQSQYMKARDISYVIHSILKPLLLAGISPHDYDIQFLLKRTGQAAAAAAAAAAEEAAKKKQQQREAAGQGAEGKSDDKEEDTSEATKDAVIVAQMESRAKKAKEWSTQHAILGHVAKTNVARPRALIASPMGERSKQDEDGTTSAAGEQRQRATLWKARIYCDQAHQSYSHVVELLRQKRADAQENGGGGAVIPNIQPHLIKLLKCLGITATSASKPVAGANQEPQPADYSVDPNALQLLLKLNKGNVIVARVLEQALLPLSALQAFLPVVLQVLYQTRTPASNAVFQADHLEADDRLFVALSRVIQTSSSLSVSTILAAIRVAQDYSTAALMSSTRMQTVHALLHRGEQAAAMTGDPELQREWAATEERFMMILAGMD